MTLEDALSYIHRVDWRGSIPGLSRIDTLLGMLGHPERAVKYIHITGTNGKGSTCAMLAAILRQAGYKTGLYTSPYIFRFNERMQIDGQPIPDEELCAITEEVRPLADSMDDHPSEFEIVTAIAFTWFARKACDIVVCEVGMGGEFDATNVIPAPEAAVLCNIGLDHTAYLGGTVEKIAATKSGIIKPGCDAVLYPCVPSVAEVVDGRCRRCGVTLRLLGQHEQVEGVEQLLREMLYNLCDNAIRYNVHGGSVKLEVRPIRDKVIVCVQDTGIGISPENQEHVFERFYRVDKARSRETGGTGLGMAIVKHIAVKHNAQIELESELGRGTKISVIFERCFKG